MWPEAGIMGYWELRQPEGRSESIFAAQWREFRLQVIDSREPIFSFKEWLMPCCKWPSGCTVEVNERDPAGKGR